MADSPEDLRSKSDDDILESMHGAMFGSNHYNHYLTILQLRFMRSTSVATRRLLIATWALVVATLLLLTGSIIQLVLN
jgi:hypothetical protein